MVMEVHDHDRDCGSYELHFLRKRDFANQDVGNRMPHSLRSPWVVAVLVLFKVEEVKLKAIIGTHANQD